MVDSFVHNVSTSYLPQNVSTSSIDDRHKLSLVPSSISTSTKRFGQSSPLKATMLNADSDPAASLKNDGKSLRPPLTLPPHSPSAHTLSPPPPHSIPSKASKSNSVNSPNSCTPPPGSPGGPKSSATPSQASSSSLPTPSSTPPPVVAPHSPPATSSATAISSPQVAYAWAPSPFFGPGALRAWRNASDVRCLNPLPLSR